MGYCSKKGVKIMNATLFSIILIVTIITHNLIWSMRYQTLQAKKNGLQSQLETIQASRERLEAKLNCLEKMQYQTGGFISETALSHHLNNIQHQSYLNAKYDDELSAKSIELSKKAILDKFVKKDETEKKEPPRPNLPELQPMYGHERISVISNNKPPTPPRRTKPSITKLKDQ